MIYPYKDLHYPLRVKSPLLSGDVILPPDAHRSRNGSTIITMLMDNNYYAWNTMDALANYYTDYELNEAYTNWDPNTLQMKSKDQILYSSHLVIGLIIMI